MTMREEQLVEASSDALKALSSVMFPHIKHNLKKALGVYQEDPVPAQMGYDGDQVWPENATEPEEPYWPQDFRDLGGMGVEPR